MEVVSRFDMILRHTYVCVLFLYSVRVTMSLYTTPSCRHFPLSGHDVLSRQLQLLVNSSLSFSLDIIFFFLLWLFFSASY